MTIPSHAVVLLKTPPRNITTEISTAPHWRSTPPRMAPVECHMSAAMMASPAASSWFRAASLVAAANLSLSGIMERAVGVASTSVTPAKASTVESRVLASRFAQRREQAKKHQIVDRQDGDSRQVEAQKPHGPMMLQQVEGLSGVCWLAAQNNDLDHRRQRVND